MNIFKISKTKLVYKVAKKSVSEAFDYIIQDDFNPDMIHLGLLDTYEDGLTKGLVIGTGVTCIICAVVISAILIKKRKEKKDV